MSPNVYLRARIEVLQHRDQFLRRLGIGEVGFRHHDAIGQDRLLARLRRLFEVLQSRHRIDHGDHHLDGEFAAQCAVGGERLQNRADVSEPAGLDQHAAEMRNLPPIAVRDKLTQRDLQIGAGVAAQAAVAEQRDLVAALAQ
jgi:hypothetical protein